MPEELISLLDAGRIGTILALVVYVSVYLARKAGLVVTGDHARIANVLVSLFFTLMMSEMSVVEKGLVALMASLLSAGIHEILKRYA